MSEEVKALVPSIVSVAVNLDKDDVAAVLMSRAETTLKKSIKECQATDVRLGKELVEKNKELEAAQEEVVAKHFKATIATLQKAATELGCTSVKHSTCCQGVDISKKEEGLFGHLAFSGKKPHIDWSVNVTIKPDAAGKALRKELAALVKAQKDNRDAWIDLRRKLADLPTLERRARAAVAEDRLSRTSDGLALIQLLDDSLEENIKLLGVN